MFRKHPLAAAVGSLSLASALLASVNVSAQTATEIEEVVVTGSRIQSAVADTPRPVSVIDRIDIELSGLESVADTMRTSAFNTIGSYREQSGSSFGQIALVNLRGLGADRTAVLINGRRVPGNPLTGSSAVDLNSIPLSAVERVEVLTDSASAIYGADAIGGVVNIIMRDDFEGAEFEIGGDFPSEDGGESDHFNFTFGAQGDRSSILFSGEWFQRKPIFDADRDYSQVDVRQPASGNPVHGVDTTGVSGGGNTAFTTDFSQALMLTAECPSGMIEIDNPEGIPGVGCGFGHADYSMMTAGIERQSTYVTASYELTEDHEIYVDNRFSRIDSYGRYAPAVGFLRMEADHPENPIGEDLDVFHRFVGHGTRDDSTATSELDTAIGFRGTLFNTDIQYDFHGRHYQYLAQQEGDVYVLESVINQAVADQRYDVTNPFSQDPDHQAAIAESAATLFRDISMEATSFEFVLNGSAFNLPAGAVGWAAGFETFDEEYEDQYDSYREAYNVLGSSGNSSAGSRSRWAVYGEAEVPVLDNLTMNLALRHDDYDDFGSEVSPSLAVHYAPIEQVRLRASYSEGFKAPNLTDLYSEMSESFEQAVDLRGCEITGTSPCAPTQHTAYYGGNPDIQPEQSESLNFGIVVDATDSFSFSIDWFNVEIEDSIQALDLQDVFDLEASGDMPSGVIVNRTPAGTIQQCSGGGQPPTCGVIVPSANVATEEISGIDLRAQYDLDTNVGRFAAMLELSRFLEYEFQATELSPVIDRIEDKEGYPEMRYNLTLRWAMDAWTVNYIYRVIGEHGETSTGTHYDDWATMDLNVTWDAPWGGELSFGARNLTNEEPEIDESTGIWDPFVGLDIYDVSGRVPYLTYRHFF